MPLGTVSVDRYRPSEAMFGGIPDVANGAVAKDAVLVVTTPEMCAPATAYLAHGSSTLGGEVPEVGINAVARILVVHPAGMTRPGLTVDDLAGGTDAFSDPSVLRVPDRRWMEVA